MVRDKNGAEVKGGDEIVIRARVIEVTDAGDRSILHVKWSNPTAFIDFVMANAVEVVTSKE